MGRLVLRAIEFRAACRFVERHHRHHLPPQGHRFSLAVYEQDGESGSDRLVGVAIVGRPVARQRDDGETLELTRCCTDGTPHVASKLYAAAWRATRALGYRRLVTYTLLSEAGTSLVAAGWEVIGETPGGSWSCQTRPREDKHPIGPKRVWAPAGARSSGGAVGGTDEIG